MRKIVSLIIIMLFLSTPALSEAKKIFGHKKKPVQVKTEQNATPPEKISEPAVFEEVEPEGVKEETKEETQEEQTDIEEPEVKEHESVIEYSQEQEYKFMHEMIKVYSEQYDKNYLDRENTLKLAKTYLDLGQRSTAKAYYMQLYNMYPNDPDIQFEMGKFYYTCKQYNAAIEFFKQSLASGNLKNIEVNEYTRKTYAKLGDEENELLYEQILDHLRGN